MAGKEFNIKKNISHCVKIRANGRNQSLDGTY